MVSYILRALATQRRKLVLCDCIIKCLGKLAEFSAENRNHKYSQVKMKIVILSSAHCSLIQVFFSLAGHVCTVYTVTVSSSEVLCMHTE